MVNANGQSSVVEDIETGRITETSGTVTEFHAVDTNGDEYETGNVPLGHHLMDQPIANGMADCLEESNVYNI